MSVAIYPGSFDPPTLGHLSIIRGGLVAFDEVVVAVLHNPRKKPLFDVDERKELLREAVAINETRVRIDSFGGLLVDYARSQGLRAILRGLRAVSDFEYELQTANMNHHFHERIETVFIMAKDAYFGCGSPEELVV